MYPLPHYATKSAALAATEHIHSCGHGIPPARAPRTHGFSQTLPCQATRGGHDGPSTRTTSANDLGRLVAGAVLEADVLHWVAEHYAAVSAGRLPDLQARPVLVLHTPHLLSINVRRVYHFLKTRHMTARAQQCQAAPAIRDPVISTSVTWLKAGSEQRLRTCASQASDAAWHSTALVDTQASRARRARGPCAGPRGTPAVRRRRCRSRSALPA